MFAPRIKVVADVAAQVDAQPFECGLFIIEESNRAASVPDNVLQEFSIFVDDVAIAHGRDIQAGLGYGASEFEEVECGKISLWTRTDQQDIVAATLATDVAE